jgi:hypothetical protein
MSKLLGAAGLYLFYREFTKGGVSPITVVPPSSPNNFGIPETLTPESEADRIAKQKRIEEERKRQEEIKRKIEQERERLLAEARFQAEQRKIRDNPPDCGFGRTAQLKGAGTRDFPFRWECILTGF